MVWVDVGWRSRKVKRVMRERVIVDRERMKNIEWVVGRKRRNRRN